MTAQRKIPFWGCFYKNSPKTGITKQVGVPYPLLASRYRTAILMATPFST